MPVIPITQLVPSRQGIQFYRDADHLDAARDELATGEDIFDPEYLPPHKPYPLPPVTGHIFPGTPAHLSSRAGTTSTGSSAATLTGAGAVEPISSPRNSKRPAGQSRAST